MAEQRRVFTKEFKQEAVRLSNESGKQINRVAAELGVPRTTLTRWRAEAQADATEALIRPFGRGRGNAKRTAEQERIRQLEREVERLKQERAVLKTIQECRAILWRQKLQYVARISPRDVAVDFW